MSEENSIQYREDINSAEIWPDIQGHVNYLNDVYNLCFSIQYKMNGKKASDFSRQFYAQMMILMRITDFLRSIQLMTVKGYPEQAGTLAASIFELAHTSVLFSYDEEAANNWLSATSVQDQIKKVLKMNWEEVVRKNIKQLNGSHTESEYRVYRQLCWLKHSLPKMQTLIKQEEGVTLNFGPYKDERSINHAWFSMEHAGRLTELTIDKLCAPDEIKKYIQEQLPPLTHTRIMLREKAKKRFGTVNPFES